MGDGATRRDFLCLTTGAMGAIALGAAVWPLIDSMNPAADVVAVATTDVNLAGIEPGQRITATWRGSPVFVVRRTPAHVAKARAHDGHPESVDPELDSGRVKNPEWLIVVGVCTHLGCVPLGQKPTDARGPYDGWFCRCHGSIYDLSGRVRKGPAPRNLVIPPYVFVTSDLVRIG